MSDVTRVPESTNRIEKALLWVLRLVMVFVLITAWLAQDTALVLSVLAVLVVHAVIYLSAPHLVRAEWRPWLLTVVDMALVGLTFYLSGNIDGQAAILGMALAAVLAARLSLWPALALNTIVWCLFTFPYVHLWLEQGEPFPSAIIANLIAYPLLTFVVNYLVSMDERQARIQQDLALRLQQLTTVHEVGQVISSTLDLDAVLDQVLDKAVELLNAEAGSLLLVEDPSADLEEAALVFRVVQGPGAEKLIGQKVPPGEGIAGQVFQSGEGRLVLDVQADPRWYTAPDVITGFQTRSILCVPLISRGRPIGVLEIVNKKDGVPFDHTDQATLSTFALQAAIALENARLYDETHRHLRRVNTLYEVGRSLATLDTQQILDTIARHTVDALQADMCGVFLYETDRLGSTRTALKAFYDRHGALQARQEYRFDLLEHARLRDRVRRDGYAAFESVETDEGLSEPVRQVLMMLDIRSCLFVGMYSHDEPTGFILVAERHRTRSFSADDIQLCQALAHQAVIAVENARLYESTDEALKKQLREMAAIEEIDHELGATLDMERIINLVLQRALEACNAISGVIGILSPDGQVLDTLFWQGLHPENMEELTRNGWPADRGVIGRVIRSGQPALIADVRDDPDYVGVVETSRSEIAVPIVREEQVIGILNLESDRLGAFDEDDLRFIQHLADHASIAIENARLFQEQRQRVQMLSAIGEIGREIVANLDLDQTLDLILARVRDLVGYCAAEICLWDEAGQRLVTYASAGDVRYMAQTGGFYRLDEGFTGWIARHRRELIIPDITAQQEVRPKISTTGTSFRAYVGLPLQTAETFIGTLEIIGDRVNAYTDDQIETLRIIADQAAVAIQNARLYEETQQRFEYSQRLLRVSKTISSTLDLTETVRNVAREMCRALGADMAGVYLADEDGRVMRAVAGYHVPKEKLDFYRDFCVPIVGHPFVEEAWRTRQAVYSLDPVHDSRLDREVVAAFPNKTTLFAPMVAHDEVIGGVYVLWVSEKREFSEEEIQLANAIAWQAGVVVENARLYERTDERLQARLDELTALQRITQELNATLSLDTVLHTVLEAALQTTGATHGNVMLLDMETGRLALRVAQGYSPEEVEAIRQVLLQPGREDLTSLVVSSGEPRLIQDARQQSYAVCVKEGTLSALAVPILYQQDVVGVIHLRHTQAHAFDRETQTFVQSLAQQAAIAIGNAMRFEEQVRSNNALRRRTEQMDRLLTISRKLRTDIPLEDALEEVAYAIQETAGFNAVLISVAEGWSGSGPVLRRVASAGLPLREFEELARVRQPVERYERILREEYRQGSCYFFPFDRREDWETDLHIHTPMPEVETWHEGQWHPRDMLLVPLRGSGGRLVGLISVDDPQDGLRPSRRTFDLLAIFGNQAAVAIENANLYRDARHRADNLALINEIGRRLSRALEPQQVLDAVVKGVPLLLNCTASAVLQPDPRDGSWKVAAVYGLDPAQIDAWRFIPGEGDIGRAVASGESLLIPDVTQVEPAIPVADKIGSILLVPISVGHKLLGMLLAAQTQKHALTPTDRMLLSTLADQAAVALESTRLLASTQKAAVRLSLLNEIGRRAAAQLEPQELLNMTVRDLHRNLGYPRVAVFLVDEQHQALYAAAANDLFWPFIPPDYRPQIGEGLIGAAAASGETVVVNDVSTDERFAAQDRAAPASLSVPIKAGDQVIGVLHAEAEQSWAFGEEDAAALEMAADQLAVALENARLFQETRRRVAELATVNEIGQALSQTLDVENLAELVYTHVGNLLDTRNFLIALYDRSKDLIRIDFRVERGTRQPPVVLQPDEGLIGYLIQTGQPMLISHGTDAFYQEHDGLRPYGPPARSWLGVPMKIEDQVVGGIVVQSYEREAAYDADHQRLLSTIAGQAAVALQNALLFGDRERRIAELSVLNEMSQAIGSALDLDALLTTVYQQVSRLFDTTNFYIATYEEGQEEWYLAFSREHGLPEPPTSYSIYRGLTGYIIRTHQPLLFHTAQEIVDFHQEREIEFVGEQARSWLGVPLIAAERVLGVIAVQSYEEENLYSQEDLDILTTLAAQVAVAVRNAQLYRQLREFSSELEARVEERTQDLEEALAQLTAERDRAETLYRITSELGATLDLERVLEHALHLFADALEVEHGTIMLLDQESGYLTLRAAWGIEEEQMRRGKRTHFTRGVGLAGWILEHREPVLIPDVTRDPRWLHNDDSPLTIRSAVAAPLSLGGGDIMGVLTLGHPEVGHFTEEHLQLVIAAAAQIAIAVNNSDLYAYITEQADQLGSMLQSQQEEAAKNRAILESIADGVLVLDHNGKVLLINPAAEELLGVSAMVIEGEHFRHMLGLGETSAQRELAQGLYSELRHYLERAQEEPGAMQPNTVRLEAEKRVLAVNIAPLITTIGGAPGLVAALRDVSREAEVERLKNEFISTVSHELRTPMTSIKGYTDLLFLGMAGGLTDTQRNFLQIIKTNADRLTALVNDILDISRIETGRLRLTIEALDLVDIVNNVVISFQEQYREKGLSLVWEPPPEELPPVRGDAARVTQVLTNLVSNAWQYTLPGGRVTITIQPADGFLQVNVSDTGIGIKEEDLGRVFDRFYRADDPVVEEAGGTGLGLSIVKMFVEMLGGQIWVESQVGTGSTFSFTLPLMTTEAPEISPELLTVEEPTVLGRRQKVLVVEDDHDLALLLRRQLEAEGYQVLLAGSGEDALWLAREEQPQLITLDIMLPDLDGFVVLERLKDSPVTAPIPVIIVSVLSDPDKGYALGAVDYVVKPFEEEKLLQSIRTALAPVEQDEPRELLVVDDDADIRGFLEQALSRHGYRVRTAASGQEALDQVQESPPDLILLDLKMPGMDGYEVIRRLKEQESSRAIPIIVITASPVDKERDKVRVLGMGASQYLVKPLSVRNLVAEIKKAIAEGPLE